MSLFTLNNTITESDMIHHIVGDIVIQANGTFDSATLSLEYSQDGLPFVTLDDFSITKNDAVIITLADSSNYKIKLNNSISSTEVQVSILGRRR